MGAPPLDDLCEGQWSLAVSERCIGAPMRSLYQIAAVIAMMRWSTRTITPAGVPAVPSEVKLGLEARGRPAPARRRPDIRRTVRSGELPGAPVIGELVPRRDSVPVIR